MRPKKRRNKRSHAVSASANCISSCSYRRLAEVCPARIRASVCAYDACMRARHRDEATSFTGRVENIREIFRGERRALVLSLFLPASLSFSSTLSLSPSFSLPFRRDKVKSLGYVVRKAPELFIHGERKTHGRNLVRHYFTLPLSLSRSLSLLLANAHSRGFLA